MITWKEYHIRIFSENNILIFDYPFRESDRDCAVAKCETFLKRYIAKKPRKATMTIEERSINDVAFESDRKYCAFKYPKTAPMFDAGAACLMHQNTPAFITPSITKAVESVMENPIPGFIPNFLGCFDRPCDEGWNSFY